MGYSGMNFSVFFYLAAVFVGIINIIGFVVMGADKYKAKKKHWRVPEKNFFLIAVLGGAAGVYAGMLFFRHKTKHWYFMVGVPAIFVAEAVTTFLLLK